MKLPIRCLALVLLACSTLTATAQQSWRPTFEKFTLPNGFTCIVHRDTTLPVVALAMTWHAGSARDPKGRSGLASLTANLAALATKHHSADSLARLIRAHRASVVALATVDWTSMHSTWPSDQLALALSIEADRMSGAGAQFTRELVASTADRLIQQRRATLKSPYGDIDDLLFRELYPEGHPYRRNSAGDTTEIRKMTTTDVQDFARQYFVPANACLTVGGRVDVAEVRRLVTSLFGSLPAGTPVRAMKGDPPAMNGTAAIIKESAVNDGRLIMTFLTVPYGHPDYPLLQLTAKILAGSSVSPLQRILPSRVHGIQSVEARQNSQEASGTFTIEITADFETNLQSVHNEVLRILTDVAKNGVSDADIQSARNQLEMDILSPLETVYGVGGRCDVLNLNNVYTGNPAYTFDAYRSLNDATRSGVRTAVRRYLNPANHLIMSVVAPMRRRLAVTLK